MASLFLRLNGFLGQRGIRLYWGGGGLIGANISLDGDKRQKLKDIYSLRKALFVQLLSKWLAEGAEWFYIRFHFLRLRNHLHRTGLLCTLFSITRPSRSCSLLTSSNLYRNWRGSCKMKIGCCGVSQGVQCLWCNALYPDTHSSGG